MNHIYKVIWSRVKNSYVVVSEIAGTARKSGGVRVSKTRWQQFWRLFY